MTRTTPPRPLDVETLFPEVAAYRKDTVRLHPRAGDPGPRESSLGGPLLWPRALDWPHCDDDHGRSAPGAGAMPLVPVLQLFATDVPELPFPAGTDVLQVLWCPFEHGYIPQPKLYWRDSSTCGGELTACPRPEGAEEDYLPDPCVLHPERVVDYPSWDLPDGIAEALAERFDRVEKETGWSYWQHLSVADGSRPVDTRRGHRSRTGPTARRAVGAWTTSSRSTARNSTGRHGEPGSPWRTLPRPAPSGTSPTTPAG